MLLTLLTHDHINTFALPEEVGGMHWVCDTSFTRSKKYGFIEAKDDEWILSPKTGVLLYEFNDDSEKALSRVRIATDQQSVYRLTSDADDATLIIRPLTQGDKAYTIIGLTDDCTVSIGRDTGSVVQFVDTHAHVSSSHARLDYYEDKFSIVDLASSNGTFVNGVRLEPSQALTLNPGDIISIMGLRIVIGLRYFALNNPGNSAKINMLPEMLLYEKPSYNSPEEITYELDESDDVDYFYPAPRFKRDVVAQSVTIDPPPAPEKPDDTPAALKIGPSMVMGLGAVFTGATMFTRMQDDGGSILAAIPMLFMAVAMVLGSVLWPLLTRRYQNRKLERNETRRKETYARYLDAMRSVIDEQSILQREILLENRVSVDECLRLAVELDPHLMDRTVAHNDFLELRIGLATLPLESDIKYPDEHFQVEKDDLQEAVYAFKREPKELHDVPNAVNLAKNPVVGIAGSKAIIESFCFGLVAQIATLHSYEDVKVVVLCDDTDERNWRWAASLPHAFSDDRALRYFATSKEEADEIGLVLERVAQQRRETQNQNQDRSFPTPYYVIVCASPYLAQKSELVSGLSKTPAPGFSLICLAPYRKNLPKQCTSILEIEQNSGKLYNKEDLLATPHEFLPDIFIEQRAARQLVLCINRVRINLASEVSGLPDNLGFFEMFEAGNLEQLNVRSRWKENKAASTLASRIGLDTTGEPFYLDLHEKFHGPHGLIAGTTGSGKSEFIITWVLSMCVEYSPHEVSFVLIDYKGGGLAKAFDNDRMVLPHLAATITNLDGSMINRSMVSIDSEIKRRQALFNKTRELVGGDNIDINKYLELFYTGRVKEPCPHLFLVADEFAELKTQEPDFMDNLIKTARVGRSLGVHLILATQKPDGVVNDQIWSNAKFKICLKVADKENSVAMIKRPDAAEITQAGRFYLLVGYNEKFALGQSAYTGSPYIALEHYEKPKDNSVALISNTGRPLMVAQPESRRFRSNSRPQLVEVLGHLIDTAAADDLKSKRLWLNPLPEYIDLQTVLAGNSHTVEPFTLDPAVGMFDDPANQSQRLLTLPLSTHGNAILYGSATSGVENLLATMLFDLISGHNVHQLHVYILDFGSEALTAFRQAPQVGDVLVSTEEEKVSRLFDMLDREVAQRRGLISKYGGSFTRYSQQVGDKPALLLIVNSTAVFNELYEKFEQRLITLAREGTRVGLNIILTASSPMDVRLRLRSNFKQSLACPLDEEGDYLTILGSMRGIAVPHGFARGLIKLNDAIYEFQAARIAAEGADDFERISQTCAELASQNPEKAPAVPTLPNQVTSDTLMAMPGFKPVSRSFVPFGVFEDTLECAAIDLTDSPIMRIVFSKQKDGLAFMRALLDEADFIEGANICILDCAHYFDVLPGKFTSETQDEEAAAALLSDLLDSSNGAAEVNPTKQQSTLIFISGISSFLAGLSSDVALSLKILLANLRALPNVNIICFDAALETSFTSEAWFKTYSSNRDGLWVGEGLDSQSAISVTFGLGERIDPTVKGARGYWVSGGKIRKAKLLVS